MRGATTPLAENKTPFHFPIFLSLSLSPTKEERKEGPKWKPQYRWLQDRSFAIRPREKGKMALLLLLSTKRRDVDSANFYGDASSNISGKPRLLALVFDERTSPSILSSLLFLSSSFDFGRVAESRMNRDFRQNRRRLVLSSRRRRRRRRVISSREEKDSIRASSKEDLGNWLDDDVFMNFRSGLIIAFGILYRWFFSRRKILIGWRNLKIGEIIIVVSIITNEYHTTIT